MAEDLDKKKLATLKPAEAPLFFATSLRLLGTGNEFLMLFQHLLAMQDETGEIFGGAARTQVSAIIAVSPQTLKDISLLINDQIAKYEKDFGELKTPFTQTKLDEKKK